MLSQTGKPAASTAVQIAVAKSKSGDMIAQCAISTSPVAGCVRDKGHECMQLIVPTAVVHLPYGIFSVRRS
jgi:hypothetical protein